MPVVKLYRTAFLIAWTAGVALGADTYKIEPAWSHVEFSVKNFGIHTVEGRFKNFAGVIAYDSSDVTRSRVTVTMPVVSVDTGIEKRDKHLQKEEFFDASHFPEITFQSLRIEKNGEGYILVGPLTMKGQTKEVQLPFTFSLSKSTEGAQTLRAEARGTIKRRDFGIDYGSNFSVSNEVQMVIHIQALP